MQLNLPYPVEKEINIDGKKVVLLKPPPKVIYNRNVLCLDGDGRILWQVTELPFYPGGAKECPFSDIQLENGKLILWNWCSFRFIVDPQTGEVLKREETR